MDYFTPQLYWPVTQTAQSDPVLLDWWLGENVPARHLWPGHNASRAAGGAGAGRTERTSARHAGHARHGDVHFSMRALMPAETVRRDSVLVGVATPPPRDSAAAALADRLRGEPYPAPSSVPASPWLSGKTPRVPHAAVRTAPASGELTLHLTPAGPERVQWWTVRLETDLGWRSWLLPGTQRALVLAPVDGQRTDSRVVRVLVMAVDRVGSESGTQILRPGPE